LDEIRNSVFEKNPAAIEEWHVAVKIYGRSFRIKDKKRAIIYLSSRKGFFKAEMVFGQKASNLIFSSEMNDIKKLVEIKFAN